MMTEPYLWWRDGVVYQIYPRSFKDSNGDGIGDLPGITSKLDYLADLGIDAIWLSPINTSPMADFGYDISNYDDIDPIFGALADFDTLIAEAHRRNIKVMMDLVINHTSHLHPWFIESRSSRTNPKADWYIWRDRSALGNYPNNWGSIFGGPAWAWDETRQQFYYHMFLKEQPDLNWRNPAARQAVMNMIRRWLDKGVDGFRLDVVNGYFKDDQFRDNPWRFSLIPILPAPMRQHRLYDADRPELLDVYAEFRRLLDSYAGRGSVGEIMGNEAEKVARYVGNDKLHMAFYFGFTHQRWLPRAFQNAVLELEQAIAHNSEAWPCYTLSNHDLTRHITRYGDGAFAVERAKVAAALLLTLRGTPFLYMGEEIAMPSPRIPRDKIVDPPGKRFYPLYTGRDNARTPMQWDRTQHAGFSSADPWLPVGRLHPNLTVADQQHDRHSVLNFYRRLIQLRRASPALRRGEYRPLIDQPVSCMMFERKTPSQTMVVALNFFAHATPARLPEGNWRRVLSTHDSHEASEGALTLAPFEATVFARDDR